MSSGAPNDVCRISLSWSLAVSEQLSITREFRPNSQTRQRWSNMNQYSVTVMSISLLKCFQKHLVVYCLAVKGKSLWPGSHVEISWRNTKHRPPAGTKVLILQLNSTLTLRVHKWLTAASVEPIGTLSLWNDLWLAFFKAWKQSHEKVQKSSFLSEHLNYNMLKGYHRIFAQWCQKL